jgi:hypothetical protein
VTATKFKPLIELFFIFKCPFKNLIFNLEYALATSTCFSIQFIMIIKYLEIVTYVVDKALLSNTSTLAQAITFLICFLEVAGLNFDCDTVYSD